MSWQNRIIGYDTKPANQFTANPLNFRRHPVPQREALRGLLGEVGWVGAVLENITTGNLIDGHARIEEALSKDENTPIPFLKVELTEAEEKLVLASFDPISAMATADKETLDLLLKDVATSSEAVEKMLADLAKENGLPTSEPKDVEPQIDKAEELRQKWGTETGQLWVIGPHLLLCGDSTDTGDVSRLMNDKQADCVFTSPPYAVGLDYGDTYEDSIENLRAMLPKLAGLWAQLVTPGGFAVVNFGDVVSGTQIVGSDGPCEYPMAVEYWPIFRAAEWVLWSRRIWCKPVARVAAPWCASSNRSATNFEHIWTWKKPGETIVGRVAQPMDSQSGWCDTSRLEGVDVGKEAHGAGMPTSIAQWMINVHSRRGRVVHEPFCGTGTTMVASENQQRTCYAAEISPGYVGITLERMTTAFPHLKIEKVDQARAA